MKGEVCLPVTLDLDQSAPDFYTLQATLNCLSSSSWNINIANYKIENIILKSNETRKVISTKAKFNLMIFGNR